MQDLLKKRAAVVPEFDAERFAAATDPVDGSFYRGTTSVVAADKEGWLVSMTPCGGWLPAVIAGRTGIGMSQRAQRFVTDPAENPFNVVEPGKRPRVTLTPSLAFKDGKPWLAFAVQGGDTQDQNLLQFFLNVVEFGMTPQQATEAPNFTSFQMRDSFGMHEIFPGRLELNDAVPDWVRRDLKARGYDLRYRSRTSGPDQRDPPGPRPGHVLGRLEQPRRGLRHRLVGRGVDSRPRPANRRGRKQDRERYHEDEANRPRGRGAGARVSIRRRAGTLDRGPRLGMRSLPNQSGPSLTRTWSTSAAPCEPR